MRQSFTEFRSDLFYDDSQLDQKFERKIISRKS